jgi:hypothetical protein
MQPAPQGSFSSLRLDSGAPQTADDPLTASVKPLPRAALAAQQRNTKPQFIDMGDEAGDLKRYEVALENWRNPAPHHSRLGSALARAGMGFIEGVARTGSLGGGIGGAASGAIYGAVKPNWIERSERDAEIGRAGGRIKQLDERAKEEAQTEGVQAQTDWMRARPEIERDKASAAEYNRRVSEFFRTANLFKGQRLDPDKNPRHARLLERGAALGIEIDPESWNESKGNMVRYTRTDPDHPEQTVEVERNVVTGEEKVLGQRGFQATRNAEGRTTAEVKSDEDRDASRTETHRHNLAGEGQGAERIGIMRQHLTLSQAAQNDKLDERDRRDAEKADKLAAQAERYQQAAEAIGSRTKYTDPNTGEEKESRKAQNQRDVFAAQAQALRRQLFSSYGDLYDRGPDGRVRMTTAQYRSMFPSLGGNFVGDAQSMGVELTDADTTGQGTPVPSPMHRPARRGARSSSTAPSEGKTHVTRADARKLYPQLKDASDTDVDAAIRSAGYEPIP